MRPLYRRRRNEHVLEHERRRSRAIEHAAQTVRNRRAHRPQPSSNSRVQPRAPGDAQPVLGIREPDPDARLGPGDRTQRRSVEGADDGPPGDTVPPERSRELVQARRQLEVDVQADAGRLLGEEGDRLVECRQLRSDLTELVQREVLHASARGAVAHLVEPIRVGYDERPSCERDDVELDEVDAEAHREPERAQRVLRRRFGGPAVPDDQRALATPAELDQRPKSSCTCRQNVTARAMLPARSSTSTNQKRTPARRSARVRSIRARRRARWNRYARDTAVGSIGGASATRSDTFSPELSATGKFYEFKPHSSGKGVTPAAGATILRPMASPEGGFGRAALDRGGALLGLGDRLTLVSGLVLTVSAFTGWYTGSGEGVTISVLGWNTGTLGKLVFFLGLATMLVVLLRELGIELPAAAPESLVTIALGSLATIFVLVRVVVIPDDFFFAGRGVGIWISLAAAIGVILAGLLQASEEL